jgi:hypothetical protein
VRRSLAVLGVLGGVALGAALACTFPSPDFVDELLDGASSSDSPLGVQDSAAPDAANADANPCKGDPDCDCDGDGDPSYACDGGDCDDHDDRVRSTQTSFLDASSSRGNDWNCDGEVEREGNSGVVCTRLIDAGWAATATTQQIEAACAKEGFVEDPGCGESGTYNRCEKVPAANQKVCRIAASGPRVRGCR